MATYKEKSGPIVRSVRSEELKTVAIIGAGPSGLVAAKEARMNHLIPTMFEKASDLGGVWNPTSGTTWKTLKANVSKYSTFFSDTDWRKAKMKKVGIFPTNEEMYNYLKDFSNDWNPPKYIRFNCTVIDVKPEPSKSYLESLSGLFNWRVRWKNAEGKVEEEVFDGVIVATGILAEPFIPHDIQGLGNFQGRVIHSKDYKDGSEFQGQRVLVVGGSFSGAEIAADVSKHAKTTIHCFRRSFFILERYLRDPVRGKKLPVDFVTFHNRNYYRRLPPACYNNIEKVDNDFCMQFCENQEKFYDLRVSKEDFNKRINIVISDDYLKQVEDRKIIPRRQTIFEIHDSKVVLENGDYYDVDVIIFATGFKCASPPIFKKDILDMLEYDESNGLLPFILYKATVHLSYPHLYFVGMFRNPFASGIEQQARWACRLLSGRVKLPPVGVIAEGMIQERFLRNTETTVQLPHGAYFQLADEIAVLSRSFPDIEKLERYGEYLMEEALQLDAAGVRCESLEGDDTKAKIWDMFMNQPVIPAHYNLSYFPTIAFEQMRALQTFIDECEE